MTNRWRDIAGVLASIAIVLTVYHQVAFEGKTFDPSIIIGGTNGANPPTGVTPPKIVDDIRPDLAAGAWQTYPWAVVIHRDLVHHQLPWWNANQGIGEPMAGNIQSAVFDPLLLGVFLHPTQRTWDLSYLFAFMLGAAATYLFLRRLGMGIVAAVSGSGAFTMGGFFAMDTSDTFVHLYAYLPILFLCVDLVVRSRRIRWVGALGVAIAGSVLAGMPEATFFVLVGAGSYGVFRAVREPRGARLPTAVRLAGAGVLGLLLAAPLLLMLAQYLPLSFNVHAAGLGSRTAPKSSLLNWLVPYVNGFPAKPVVAGLGGDRGWCGTAVATLAVMALAAPKALKRYGGWFFLALGVIVLCKNHNMPIFRSLGLLPGFSRADSLVFAAPVGQFALAVAAAIAVDALSTGSMQARGVLALWAAVAGGVGLLLYANKTVLAAARPAFAVRNEVLAAGVMAVVLGACLLGAAVSSSQRIRLAAAGLVGVTALVELFLVFPQGIYPPIANPYHPPPYLATLERGIIAYPDSRVFGFDGLLYPNTASVFGLQDARSVNALFIERYVSLVRQFITPGFTDRLTGDGVSPAQLAGNPMFNLLGVRYVLTPDTTFPQFPLAASLAGVQVYEDTGALPRSFVVSDVHRVAGEKAALEYLSSQGSRLADNTTRVTTFDPGRQAVVEVPAGTVLPQAGRGVPTPRPVTIASYGPNRVVVDAPAGSPGLVVLTDAYFPGWRATVNGRPSPIMATDVAFRGVWLDGSASRIVFSYHPPGGPIAWALPLLGVLGLLGVGAVLHRRRSGQRP